MYNLTIEIYQISSNSAGGKPFYSSSTMSYPNNRALEYWYKEFSQSLDSRVESNLSRSNRVTGVRTLNIKCFAQTEDDVKAVYTILNQRVIAINPKFDFTNETEVKINLFNLPLISHKSL